MRNATIPTITKLITRSPIALHIQILSLSYQGVNRNKPVFPPLANFQVICGAQTEFLKKCHKQTAKSLFFAVDLKFDNSLFHLKGASSNNMWAGNYTTE